MKFIANKLKDKYKVYLFDRRCCGKSERNCTLTYEESAKGVYEFINKLNIDMKTIKRIAKKIFSGNVLMTPTGMIPMNL